MGFKLAESTDIRELHCTIGRASEQKGADIKMYLLMHNVLTLEEKLILFGSIVRPAAARSSQGSHLGASLTIMIVIFSVRQFLPCFRYKVAPFLTDGSLLGCS